MNPALVIGCCAAASQTPVGQTLIGYARSIGATLIGEPLDRVTSLIGSADVIIADEAPRCNSIGCVVGAEELAQNASVWVKARFYQEGPFLCATVYSVAAGEPEVFTMKVDVRPIARAIMRQHTAMHAQETAESQVRGGVTVGFSLGKIWRGAKKAASSVAKGKLVKGVVAVTKTIAKGAKTVVQSKALGVVAAGLAAFPLTAPLGVPTLAAYAAANATLTAVDAGRKTVQTAKAAGTILSQGVSAATRLAAASKTTAATVKAAGASMSKAQTNAITARVKAAGSLHLNAKGKVAVATALAKAAPANKSAVAKMMANKLKGVALLKSRVALATSLPPKAKAAVLATTKFQVAAGPAIAKAKAVQAKLAQPAVKAKLLALRANGVQKETELKRLAVQAQTGAGGLDAQKSAAVINLVARNRDRIQAMSQSNAGGLPGILITSSGQVRRGKWKISPLGKGATTEGMLYTGPGKLERGAFAAVSGLPPSDGTRLMGPGANVYGIGPYGGAVGCEDDELCERCATS